MKTVLFVNFTNVFGGGEVYLKNLLTYKNRDIKKILLTPLNERMLKDLNDEILVFEGEYREEKLLKKTNIKRIIKEIKLIKFVIKKYDVDVIFFNGKDSYQLAPFIQRDIVKVGIWHGIIQGKDWLRKTLNFIAFISLDKIISICNFQKNIILEVFNNNLIKEKIEVINLGVKIPENIKVKKNKIVLSIVARLEEGKGHLDLLEVMKKIKINFKNVELNIVGDGILKTKINEFIKLNNLETNVKMLGFCNPNKILEQTDIFILPSYNEAFPLSILEAMSYGIPIISTKIGGIPEIVTDEEGILIKPGDLEALYNAITKMCLDLEKRIYMGKNAKTKIKVNFNLENINKKTYNFLFQEE